MSGHSKWNNIKRKKEKTDAQRGRIFTKIGREIAVAVKAGGPDPVNNARLGDVLAKATAAHMPNDASDVRHCFDKCGGSLGATGCVGWMFDKKGLFAVSAEGHDADEIMMLALDAGAEDFSEGDGVFEISCDPADFHAVRTSLEEAGLEFLSAEIVMVPQNTVSVDDETRAKIERMIDMLEDSDDVQNIYHNAELPEDDEE